MAKRIERLILTGFRGATCPFEIEFDSNKPVAMIFGENGAGKSTIVDAIDFVCNGEYGSLTDRSSTNPKLHLPSLGSQGKNLKVSLVFGGQSWTRIMGKSGPEGTGPEGRPVAYILRRSQILQVINAQPKARYEALQSFIAVSGVQRCEDALRRAINMVSQQAEKIAFSKQQAEKALEDFWKAEGSPGRSFFEWAMESTRQDSGDLEAIKSTANQILSAFNAALEAKAQFDKDKLRRSEYEGQCQDAENTLKNAEAGRKEQDRTLINVLENALSFLEVHKLTPNCPVCEHGIDAINLRQRITKRLAEMNSIVRLKVNLEADRKKSSEAKVLTLQSERRMVSAIQKLGLLVRQATLKEITSLAIDWKIYSRIFDDKSETVDLDMVREAESLLKVIASVKGPLTIRQSLADKALIQLGAVRAHLETIRQSTEASLNTEQLAKRLGTMLQIVENERKGYVESVLTGISKAVEDLYSVVHPEEGIGDIRLYLKPNVIGSLEFGARFQSEPNIPPQAYYSESHLDTLGICVFLALTKHFSDAGNTIVVLDDVVTSVDQTHLVRFIQLLHDEAANFDHLIITTHYRPWRDKYLFARGPSGNIQLIELLPWSLSRGIRHVKAKISIDELRSYIRTEPMDRQIVASKAGILLESLLDYVTLLYRCKLPRQADSSYSLYELVNCLGKRLKGAIEVKQIADDGALIGGMPLKLLLDNIAGMTWIRNQVGCHWNVAGMDVSDSEVSLLAENTIKLAESLICQWCGDLPRRDKSGVYWECHCSRKRLYPLNNPD